MSLAPALLAIETAGAACSAAVVLGAGVVAAERRSLQHGHAEVLLPMIERVMAEAGLAAGDLDIVAAAVGPGGFTGIRVGLAAAQGIALAAGAGGVGVSSFEAVAAVVADAICSDDRALLVALDSRRDDLYVQLFAPGSCVPLAPAQSVLPAALADCVAAIAGRRPLRVAGDAAAAAVQALAQSGMAAALSDAAPDASGVAAAALGRLRRGERAAALRPFYLRPPDVSLPRQPTTGFR
ncbi:MAG TPA: tRNA (adenosine(37)-N6)-threonylcarbamoyltransferase complex dimerization subunit type 1 TsaB [Stellaceae bacterium]|nr:tRNA (adenosine(37)-N6)-threonylcarbamoyltransferase complex dimerization subunit type 1 TsaB [Stellaceae bacterium]